MGSVVGSMHRKAAQRYYAILYTWFHSMTKQLALLFSEMHSKFVCLAEFLANECLWYFS